MNQILLSGWTWYPSVLIGFGIWTAAYALATSYFRIRNGWGESPTIWQQVLFHLGTLIGLIALVSPLDKLGDEYLFSAHMIQHLLLMFATVPLWLVGTPGWLIGLMIPSYFTKFAKWITLPLPAFAMFTGVMCLWHFPYLYGLAQDSEAIHILEHLTFIGAALIGWWPVAASDNLVAPPQSPPVRMLYLFLLGIPMTVLSAILTFSSIPLYSFYVHAPHLFGLSALEDQRLGALLMWVPAHMVLFLAFGIIFQKWFDSEEQHADDALYTKSLL
jgi:cytochrome c oxidase assembly factor CtaG